MNDVTREDLPPVGSRVPLLFSYRDTLFGNGFIVEVSAKNGRALCVREADGFWMYGINPGGMAAVGEDPDSAHAAFRKTFSNILIDLVMDSENFEAFRAEVVRFFGETNAGYEPEWYSAVQAVRDKQVHVVGIPALPADSPRDVTVEIKSAFRAADNRADLEARIAA
jgi:hypothetical protein